MDGDSVVDRGTDPGGLQLGQHPVTVGDPHHVVVPDVLVARQGGRQRDPVVVAEPLGVQAGRGDAPVVPFLEVAELGRQHDGLGGVERAGLAQVLHPAGEAVVVDEDGTAVAVGAEVHAGMEAGDHSLAPRPRRLGVTGCAGAVGGVLEEHRRPVADHRGEVLHRGHLPEEMHGHDSPRPGGATPADVVRVEEVVDRVTVGEDGPGAGPNHRRHGGQAAVGRDDGLAAGADPSGLQHKGEGVSAAGDAEAVAPVAEGRQRRLEVGDGLPLGDGSARHGADEGFDDLGSDFGML